MNSRPDRQSTAPRLVIATDKFAGSLTGSQVRAGVRAALASRRPRSEIASVAIADGGDGTVDAALAAGYTRAEVRVSGPGHGRVPATYARHEDTAVVEMANTCGRLLAARGIPTPLDTSSLALGQIVRAALESGARTIIVGLGGSASTDGGAGLLTGLGARLLDARGQAVPPSGRGLRSIARVDLETLHPALADVRLLVASDVDNPLCGASGAARVFGPQKGASPAEVRHLDDALNHFADALASATGVDNRSAPGAGAGGGVGVAALALGGVMHSGADLMLDIAQFDPAIAGATLVITGEGSLDQQTLRGKAVAAVARRARIHGVPVAAVAGRCALTTEQLRSAGIRSVHALNDIEPDVHRCMSDADRLLDMAVGRLCDQYGDEI